jgi:isoleucyl-tRNA synthetase
MNDTVTQSQNTPADAAAARDQAPDYRKTVFLPRTAFPMKVRPARRPALRQWRDSFRHGPQQDAQGFRRAQPGHPGPASMRLTCPAGTVTGCRSNGRSRRNIAPKANRRTMCPSISSGATAANSRALDRRAARSSSSGWAVSGEWDKPYTTMDFRAEATIARELHKFVANKLLYRGFPPCDVVAGREDRARRSGSRISREVVAHDLCESFPW